MHVYAAYIYDNSPFIVNITHIGREKCNVPRQLIVSVNEYFRKAVNTCFERKTLIID